MSQLPGYQMVNALQAKDSRWLQLEVCREFQRNKCSRSDAECKFAHPLPHVEVQNGKITACFDSIKGKCNREKPPCKYFHPPQHLKEQLIVNGRNNLAMKNMLWQQLLASGYAVTTTPMASPAGSLYPGLSQAYYLAASPPVSDTPLVTSAVPIQQIQQKLASDRLEGEPVYDSSMSYYNVPQPFPPMGVAYNKRPSGDKSSVTGYYAATAPSLAAYQQAVMLQQQQQQQQQQQHSYLQQAYGASAPPTSVPRYSTY